METVEIRSKSLLIQWLTVESNSLLSWQLHVKRKSIKFDIYHKKNDTSSLLDGSNKNTDRSILHTKRQHTHEAGIKKLSAAGLELFYQGERCMSEKPSEGSVYIENGGLYAFVFDNTFSKTKPKTVTFLLTAQPYNGPRIPNASVHGSPKQIISGTLLKKRRKKGQGYARRYFTLNMVEGTISYYANENSSVMRGKIPLSIAVISVAAETHEINVDSGVELWNLRAHTHQDWLRWCNALEKAKNSQTSSKLVVDERTQESSSNQLVSIYSRLRECLDIAQLYRTSRIKSASSHNFSVPEIRIQLPGDAKENKETRTSVEITAAENAQAAVTLRKVTRQLGSLLHELECFIQHHEYTKERTAQSSPSSRMSMDSNFEQHWYDAEDYESTTSQLNHYSESGAHAADATKSSVAHNEKVEDISDSDIPIMKTSSNSTSLDADRDSDTSSISDTSSNSSAPHEQLNATSLASTVDESSRSPPLPEVESNKENDIKRKQPFHDLMDSSSPDDSSFANAKSDEEVQKPSVSKNIADGAVISITKPLTPKPSDSNSLYPLPHSKVGRRKNIPAITVPPPSILSILRKNIGKDISSIPAPVVSNEPCNLLQRCAEDLEYSNMLDKANECDDDIKIFYVAAFAVSNFSNMRHKERSVRKVFSPLLGETFELVREDRNYRFLAEKVCHRPLIIACHAESRNWIWNHSPKPIQKFWGKSVELNTLGPVTIKLACGTEFSFMKPACFLKNVAIGEKYVEPYDHMEIVDETTGDKAVIRFKSGGMFSGRSEDVLVTVIRSNGEEDPKCLQGKWTSHLDFVNTDEGNVIERIWEVGPLVDKPEDHCGMTVFAAQMNEITDLEKDKLPPTDTRLRPDQRYRENNDLDHAEPLKLELEQKQRERRKEMEEKDIKWEPRWFVPSVAGDDEDEDGSGPIWQLKKENNYWESRENSTWSSCPKLW
ncbi:Sterol binding ankyrin repeat protein [Schizosaccharomyces pombe]